MSHAALSFSRTVASLVASRTARRRLLGVGLVLTLIAVLAIGVSVGCPHEEHACAQGHAAPHLHDLGAPESCTTLCCVGGQSFLVIAEPPSPALVCSECTTVPIPPRPPQRPPVAVFRPPIATTVA